MSVAVADLSPLQQRGLAAIRAWLADPRGKQTFYLAGVAGSGKSTCMEHAVADLKGQVVFAAPTGKATRVMRSKGCPTAQTIHQLAYTPTGDPPTSEDVEKLRVECKKLYASTVPGDREKANALALKLQETEAASRRKGPGFKLNRDGELKHAKVAVLDEVSMIDSRMGTDLESFEDTKFLVIGDPAQLPPVYGEGYFTRREPDFFLDEIHRQALDSPILKLADLARRKQQLPYGQIGPGVDVIRYNSPGLEERALNAEMIIVGRNATRHACNVKKRRLQGRTDPVPMQGDRVVCRRNNHDQGFLNGSLWKVEHCEPNFTTMIARIVISSLDEDRETSCDVWLHPFMGREKELGTFQRRRQNEFQYASALTCHSSQGSDFDDVLVFDESSISGRDWYRWLYTAVTRSRKTLTVVR